MGMGSKAQTVGYKYHMGVQLALCHGPVDQIKEFIYGEETAWTGNVTANGSFFVDKPNLFGGDSREGGVVGWVDVMMGGRDQGINPYLKAKIDGPVPAYRGLTTIVYRGNMVNGAPSGYSFQWSSGNPYFKNPWWRIARYTQGWSRGEAWYPAKAQIGRDMNPAHIIYECLTNIEWGMGYSPNDIDEVTFRSAADRLYSEGFGMSLLWTDQVTIEDFITLVVGHIDASVRLSLHTGKFQINLIRNDYDNASLPELNPSNILELSSFQRTAWGDTANEVVVKYRDRNQKDTTIAVQDLACIEVQGSIISTTKEYVGLREDSLANRVAIRELHKLSTPLAKVTLTCNRVAWDWNITDVFVLTWPKLGLNRVPFRIADIDKGDLVNGQITIQAMEDIFGLPSNAYVQPQQPGWVDPISQPKAPIAQRAMEVPYWDIVRNYSAADIAYLNPDYAFGEVMAVSPSNDAYGFDLWASSDNSNFQEVSKGTFTPSGIVTSAIARGGNDINLTITNMVDVDDVELDTYAYIDNEAFLVRAFNIGTGQITLGRAVLDTVPAPHVVGSRIYFSDDGYAAYDLTQRTEGETTYYKALTRTGRGTQTLSSAQAMSIRFQGRAQRPYPPANVRINGVYFPSATYGSLSVDWSHRSRTQQTVSLIPFATGNIGPETGTTYTVRLFSDNTLLRTYSAIVGTSWSFPPADDIATGVLQNLRLEIESVRDGDASWQKHDITIDRHGFGFHFGEEFGGVAS